MKTLSAGSAISNGFAWTGATSFSDVLVIDRDRYNPRVMNKGLDDGLLLVRRLIFRLLAGRDVYYRKKQPRVLRHRASTLFPSSAAGKEPFRTALPDHALIAGRVQ